MGWILMAISFVGISGQANSDTEATLTMTSPAGVEIDDVYVAVLVNRHLTAGINAVTASGSNPASDQTKIIEGQTIDTVSGDYHNQYTVFVGVVTTGGAQSYSFTKETDDNRCFLSCMAFYRGVDTTDPVDATAVGVTETETHTDNVSFPAFDPTSTDVEVIFAAFYAENATTFSAAMSADTNPDCTTRFDVETTNGDDAGIALTSGANDGSNVAARTWASNSTLDASNSGVVFALVAAGAGGGGSILPLVAVDMRNIDDMGGMRG